MLTICAVGLTKAFGGVGWGGEEVPRLRPVRFFRPPCSTESPIRAENNTFLCVSHFINQRPDPHRGDAKAPLSRPWPTPETPCNNPAPPSRCHDHQGVGNVGRARACRFRAGWGFEYFPGKRVPDEVHRAHSVGWTHWAHLVLCWGHWFVQEENVGKTSKPQSKHYILNEGQTEQEPRVLLSGGGEHDREHRQEGG